MVQITGDGDCRPQDYREQARDASDYKSSGQRLPGLEGNLSSLNRLWLDLVVTAGKD